ncbi:stage III sporulation protein AE [Desulfitobacterium sp.]|uniref:stage III sporulation protein AE n=1 Tax=Desulfitobacterium sp. TaxID=49981 RepID=UPI002B21E992|nr:stage III sporulation protein AE [Desulfitobacterium sp.]MEA4903082.1 stage III sporulation protein AE [Desulfitobacterium sp.]
MTCWTTPKVAWAENISPSGIEDTRITVEINSDQMSEKAGEGASSRSPETTGSLKADALEKQFDLSEVRGFLDQIDRDVQTTIPNFSLSQIFDDLRSGKLSLEPQELGRSLLSFLGREILKSGPIIGKLLVLAVLIAVLQNLQNAFSSESIAKMVNNLSYLVLMVIGLAAFQETLKVATEAIDRMTGFLQTLFPVILTLLMAMGNLTTAALFKPVVVGSLTLLATLMKNIILPLFLLTAVLKLFNNISGEFKLGKIAGLFEFSGKVGIGILMTVFIGVMTIQGVTGGVADGVTLRTAKYTADLIPVVGKFFKDAVEIVASSGLLMKNALGVIGILAIALICIGPALRIAAMIFVFKISSALVEPLGLKELSNSLQDMSKSLTYIFASVASLAIMFFISIAIIVGAGNLTVMLR